MSDPKAVGADGHRVAFRYWTTIVPVMAAPCTAQSYRYVPGVLNVTEYVWPFPLRIALLAKPDAWTLCEMVPVPVQVQVTVLPAATVSTAGF